MRAQAQAAVLVTTSCRSSGATPSLAPARASEDSRKRCAGAPAPPAIAAAARFSCAYSLVDPPERRSILERFVAGVAEDGVPLNGPAQVKDLVGLHDMTLAELLAVAKCL
jgi:hypothetical protein